MRRKHLRSSAVRSVGYDERDHVLEVRYIDGGLYRYFDVPPLLIDALDAAPSKGQFINRIVKKYFRTEKVEDERRA